MEPTVLDRLLAIGTLFQQDNDRAFAGTPLTETRTHALWVLHHMGPTTQQALARVLGTTPRSVSALVDGLAAAGYVERRPHPDDRRAVLVTLTAQADTLVDRMRLAHAALNAKLLDAVDDSDRAAFERGVNAVFWALQAMVRRGDTA